MSAIHCYFCGGPACKYEDFKRWTEDENHPNAIDGLYSNWITEKILAMQRPSTRLMKEHNLIAKFKEFGIRSIFNLQMAHEHKSCGDGIDERGGAGFSYVPEDWMNEGISHYGFGWPDMDVPDKLHVLKIVQVMSHDLDVAKGKVAVHCHAGLGRTGLTIACYLVYAHFKTPSEAIQLVRSRRPRSIQTPKQQLFIHQFKDYLLMLHAIYPMTISQPFFNISSSFSSPTYSTTEDSFHATEPTVLSSTDHTAQPHTISLTVSPLTFAQTIENQRLFLHGADLRTFWNVPKAPHMLVRHLVALQIRDQNAAEWTCARVAGFMSGMEVGTRVHCLMQEMNVGRWEVLEDALVGGVEGGVAVLVDLLLGWICLLKEPLLSNLAVQKLTEVCNVARVESEPVKALSLFETYNKPLFWTLNVLIDFYRHMPEDINKTTSFHHLATLMTSKRSSTAANSLFFLRPSTCATSAATQTRSEYSHLAFNTKDSLRHDRTTSSDGNVSAPMPKTGNQDSELGTKIEPIPSKKATLPALPPKQAMREFWKNQKAEGRKRGASEPPLAWKPSMSRILTDEAVSEVQEFLQILITHCRVVDETRPEKRLCDGK
ncbi:hypothetical protein BC830DRAFT_1157063 [Chytriomyces sp. MP71]|nr:hypothetical protein BC830DRAFT_1157063 [Chytriomyces sp. MP71]